MDNINDIRKNWHTLVENFRSNGTIKEIDFKDKAAFKAYDDKHKMRPDTEITVAGKKMKAGDVSGDQQGEPEEKQWKREEGEYTARYPEGDASVEDKIKALVPLWNKYKNTDDSDAKSAIKDEMSKYTSWDGSFGGASYVLDLVDDAKSAKDVAKIIKNKEKWLDKKRAAGGEDTSSEPEGNVQGYNIDGYEGASKGQKAVMDTELQISQGISDDEAQEISDKIMSLSSPDDVYAYYKDERDFSENDAVSLASAFGGETYKGGERAGAVADKPDDFKDVPKTDDKADDKAPDDEWYGDDDQFFSDDPDAEDIESVLNRADVKVASDFEGDPEDVKPFLYSATTRLGDSAEDYIEFDDEQGEFFIDSYDQDGSQVTVEPGDEITFKNTDGKTVMGAVTDEKTVDDKYKIKVHGIEETYINPFENRLLKSIIKGKK